MSLPTFLNIPSKLVQNLYLGFVPLLGLVDVFGGQVLILQADVPQSSCQVRFSHLHVHLHMLLLLHLTLQLQHFLQCNQWNRHVQIQFCQLIWYSLGTLLQIRQQSILRFLRILFHDFLVSITLLWGIESGRFSLGRLTNTSNDLAQYACSLPLSC